jgi:proteasome lid subunit RPN8/RPN11
VISLSHEVALSIRTEGERAYPDECCGFLLGRAGETDRTVAEILPVQNDREEEERYHRFAIGPDDFMRAEREACRLGLDVLGFYHSHPDHPAIPSDFDREPALPFNSYVIISVEGGRAGDITSWELSLDRAKFEREL